ncbi:alpha/beta hydrolase [Bacillus sp. FJAT-27245]|uniref:alpha/beta hydrolase n=1 Tax=Bacillus sp. FJAT-27245 TaxID=1684144 RepID=UPI0006A77391|nr:alpha/beta hydrolase [Bacillus sp. FJAT-27245]
MLMVIKKVAFYFLLLIIILILSFLAYRYIMQKKILNAAKEQTRNNGISEMVELEVNGTKQYLLIEGKDVHKPVILFLHGGPGQPLPFGVSSRGVHPRITEDFVAVYYDQRGSGKSYHKDIPIETMKIEQFLKDTDVVVDYLLKRFETDEIYVSGLSWGSILGMKYIHQHPEKVKAYFGISQFVNNAETQKRTRDWLLQIAEKNNDEKMKDKILSFGNPPYLIEDEEIFSEYMRAHGGDNYSNDEIPKVDIIGDYVKPMIFSPDYTLGDIYKVLVSGANFSLFEAKDLAKEIQLEVNLKEEIEEIKVPIYIFQGKHDKSTDYGLAKEFFDSVKTKEVKEFIELDQSAHYPSEEDFKEYLQKMIEVSKQS